MVRWSVLGLLLRVLARADTPGGSEPPAPTAIEPRKAGELEGKGFQWKPALLQAGLFAGIQHSFRIATEPATRQNLGGPFWRDYLNSAKSLHGWEDGDPHMVNYVGHPMMGAVTGYIQVQNDPRGRTQVFGIRNREYWKSRLRATAFSAAYSIQFELGPISESSIGNVGIDGKGHGAVDLVLTPALGLAWQATEDALDRYVVHRLEKLGGHRTGLIRDAFHLYAQVSADVFETVRAYGWAVAEHDADADIAARRIYGSFGPDDELMAA